MKKRLLSALLALALVFVLLPTTALAGETTGSDYDISINGTGWKFETDDSGACIPVYYYADYTFNTEAGYGFRTNDNLMLTKEGNTVTITIRRGTSHDYRVYPIEFTLEKKSTTSGSPYDYTPCIEMGNNNNLVITGKGTLNITRDEKNGIGAALCSEVGDITITDGITVKANFLKQVSNSTVGNAISVKDHNLIISGKNTKVEAKNSSCNFQDLYEVSATVCVENGEIKVSDGATLSAINNFTNSYTSQYSYYSRAISGSSSKPCALTVTGENSCVIAETDNSLGKAYGYVNFSIDGAKIEVGTSSSAQTITDINDISKYKYAKISVPALEEDSYVYIAGGPAVVGVRTSLGEGNGYYTYNKDTKTFTLENVNITSVTNAIQLMADGTYTINLVGTNTISDVSAGIVASNLYGANDITAVLSGTGSLDITAGHYAINMQTVGNLKFENTGTIKLTTGYTYPASTCNALHVAGNVTIDKTKYDIVGVKQDIEGTRENISDNPNLDTILKGTSAEEDLYFKSITITPAAAKDSTISYDGTTLKQGETITDRNGGTATVDSENNTITLKNFNGTALSFDATLADSTLVLEGTNTLSSIVTTQKGLTISGSGSGSLTVGSIRVPNNTQHTANLTITGGAHVTVNRPSGGDEPAVDVSGNLTVTGDGTQLSAECTAATNPAIEVGGNASFTGSTVTITNNSTALHKDAADKIKGDSVSSALYVKGDINITENANVTAKVENGGGNAIGALGNITVNGSTVTAVNKGQKFTTIIAENVYVSGDSKITANNLNENPVYNGSYLAFPAIEGSIVNQNTDYSLMFVGKRNGSSEPETTLAPGEKTTLYYYNVTITRGDEVTRTNSPVVIDGHTLLNDTYYTINGSTVAEGTENNYNAFYDSETKTLKLNNAQISHSFAHEYGDGTDGAIIFKEYKNYCIELSGTNTISSMNTYAINGDTNSLTIKNADGAENAKLTLTGNWTAICSTEGLNIQSDVTMVNTKRADHLMYVNGTFSFDGYNAYASVNASGSPLVEYTVPTSGDKDAGYQYLRITKETLETGGGSTHQHTYDQSAWKSDATHHWQECTDPNCPDPTKGITNKAPHSFSNGACTVCGYRGQTEEHHFSTDWTYDETHHWHACTDDGCTAIKDKAPHEWTGWRIDEPSPGMHNRFCNCGYNDYSHHYNLVYAAAGEAGHYQYCTLGNCTFKTSTVPHNYDGDTCTICNYTKSGEIVPPTPDNPGTIVIIRPAEEEKPAQQPNPSTGANDLVGLAVAAAVAAALGSAALLRKHD